MAAAINTESSVEPPFCAGKSSADGSTPTRYRLMRLANASVPPATRRQMIFPHVRAVARFLMERLLLNVNGKQIVSAVRKAVSKNSFGESAQPVLR